MGTGEKLRYMVTAFAVSFLFPLPLLPYLLMDNGLMIGLARLAFSLLTVPGVLALCVILPLVCGWSLAARAHFPPTFCGKFLPLLLPPCVYLFLMSRHLRVPPTTFAELADGVRFLLLPQYGLFFLAFLVRNRTRETTRGRRGGLACLLLTAAVCGAVVGVDLYAVRRVTFFDDAQRIRPYSLDDLKGVVLPAAPPSLRLEANLPRLDGTLSALPLYAAAARAVDGERLTSDERRERHMPPVVECNGMDGWERLAAGEIAFFFGPPPSQRRLDEWCARGLTPDVRPLAHEALVFFVREDEPVSSLSREQLRRIATGEITNWEEVGGRDERIFLFQHEQGDENQRALEQLILRGEEAAPPLWEERQLDPCDSGPVRRVAAYRKRSGALGFGLRWYLDKWFPDGDVRPLAVDGVPPTDASLRDGSYPLIVPLCLISCRPLDDDSRAFRDWLLGPEGRDLIRRAGYLPWDEESDGDAGNGGGSDGTRERKDTEEAR